MIGYRVASTQRVHLYEECVEHRAAKPPDRVTLVRTFAGVIRLFDEITKQTADCLVCKQCVARHVRRRAAV